MSSNLYHFSGFFIPKDNNQKRFEGVFDIGVKESVHILSLDIRMTSIIFKKESLLTCKVSSEDVMFKQVKSLDFLFYPSEGFYIAKVFVDKPFDQKPGTDNRIEKDSTPKEEKGIIITNIFNRSFLDYDFANQKLLYLENQKNKRESSVGAY